MYSFFYQCPGPPYTWPEADLQLCVISWVADPENLWPESFDTV